MRRWLPLALLIAIAGLIGLVLSQHARQVELAPAAQANRRAESQGASPATPSTELAAQPDSEAKRELVATAAPDSTASAPESKEPATLLVVHAIGKLDHAPLAGVRMYLHPKVVEPGFGGAEFVPSSRGDLHKAPITGREGTVEFEVPPRLVLELNADVEDGSGGSAQLELSGLHAGERREVVVELAQGDDAHVAGKVVSAETEAPIAGARVRLIEASETYSGSSGREWTKHDLAQATTGVDGAFELRFSSWKHPHLRVEAEGFGLRLLSPEQEEKEAPHALLVKLARAGTLDVHVLDASGKGIAGASVVLDANGYALNPSEMEGNGFFLSGFVSLPDERWKCETGADGRALFQGLPAGVGLVAEVRQQGKVLHHEAEEIELAPGETREIEWHIGAGSRVNGLVLDQDQQPVKGQEIWLEHCLFDQDFYFQRFEDERIVKRATTDKDGRFVLEDVPAGKWWIGPAAVRSDWDAPQPDAVAPMAQVITTAGEPVRELTLHVFRGLYIRGTVVDPTGAPVADSYVHGEVDLAMIWLGAQSGKDGTFAFGPITAGAFMLTADSTGKFASSEPVRTRSGDTGVVLRLKPGASIRGHVIDAATGAGCKAQLMFSPEQPSTGMFGNEMATSTDADGSFQHDGFEPGRYGITAMTADGRFAQQSGIDVAAGAESGDIVLALKPGGRLRLVYQGAQPHLFVRISCGGARVNFGDKLEPGKSKELLAPAGALVLELQTESDAPPRQQSVELKPGETKEITLTDER